MVKMGALKDPRQDNAAGDVLAAFEAAHRNGLPSVDCYRAAVEAWRRVQSRSYGPVRGSAGRQYRFGRQDEPADRGSVMAARRQCAVSMSRWF